MGVLAVSPKPRTSVPGDAAERFPCRLDLEKTRAPDEAWSSNIIYLPLRKDSLDLVAIIDRYSRHFLSRSLSNGIASEFCLEAVEMALESERTSRVFHSDQGCQFTSADVVGRLKADAIGIITRVVAECRLSEGWRETSTS